MNIPPNGFIHPSWGPILPPFNSTTHPTFWSPDAVSASIALPRSRKGSRYPIERVTSSSGSSSETSSTAVTSRESSQTGLTRASVGVKVDLDRFTSAYIPMWLRHLPKAYSFFYLSPDRPFPPIDFAHHVYSPFTLAAQNPITRIYDSLLSKPACVDAPPPFDGNKAMSNAQYYAQHFSSLLSLQLGSQIDDVEQLLVHQIPVWVVPGTANTFRVQIPGIREDAPKLMIGDRMFLRGLYIMEQLPSQAEVEAEVVGVVKAQGWVYIRSPHLLELDKSLPRTGPSSTAGRPALYQIRIMVSTASSCDMQDAVRQMTLALTISHSLPRQWLFPDHDSLVGRPGTRTISWIDHNLNEEQQDAVTAIVSRQHRVPFLISGPPGTGKTKTLVEAILQILAQSPGSAILVCAPSNPAADTIARRLSKVLKPDAMFRLNAPNRTFAEVSAELTAYCHIDGDHFGLPHFSQLMAYRVVVCTCLDAAILHKAKVTNMMTMQAQYDLLHLLDPTLSRAQAVLPHWTHLLVDEAAQASEPETLVPLSVVVPYPLPDAVPTQEPVVVLCGDIHQLGPVMSSRQARDGGLDVSLLERLFERDIYAKHSAARANMKRTGNSEGHPPPFANLVQNYRSIAPLLMPSTSLFYDDTLKASAKDVSLISWSKLPNPHIPILFQGCDSEEDWVDEGAARSWYNVGEIDQIVQLIKSLLGEVPFLQQKEIAVITPWREQVWKLRTTLRKNDLGGIDVGNVETYQGGEFRVTFLSCVRSRERFLDEDRRLNMGFFHEPKRFNVAITRAKELLVVVGNANLLKKDPYWNGFLQIALRTGLYRGPPLDMEMTDACLSSIETEIRNQNDSSLDVNDTTLFLADAVARQLLRDG